MDYSLKIIDFLQGNALREEISEISKQLTVDEQFVEDVRLQQEVLYAVKYGGRDMISFRNQLREVGDEFLEDFKPRPKFNFYWAAAASVAIIVGALSLWHLLDQGSSFSNDQLFAMYYSSFESPTSTRGGIEGSDFDSAVFNFSNGNYSEALSLFAAVKETKPEAAGFYQALCHIELGQFDNALVEFGLIESDAVFYYEHIQWYKTLVLLKMERFDAAKSILDGMASSDSFYASKAEELLKELS